MQVHQQWNKTTTQEIRKHLLSKMRHLDIDDDDDYDADKLRSTFFLVLQLLSIFGVCVCFVAFFMSLFVLCVHNVP